MNEDFCTGCGHLTHKCICPPPTTCWYKEGIGSEWETGFFHKWGTNYEEFESGPGHFPVAIVEDATNSQVHVVFAGFVNFSPNHPDAPEDEPEEPPLYESSFDVAARKYMDKQVDPVKEAILEATEAARVATKAAEAATEAAEVYAESLRDDDDGWIGEAAEAAEKERESGKRCPLDEKPKRFKPRLEWIDGYSRWLVQVHPETIEVFNDAADFVCQVRWVGGEMDYTQGGLPLAEIEDMFMEAN